MPQIFMSMLQPWLQLNASFGTTCMMCLLPLVQAQEPPARPQGLEDLLHLLAAQQATIRSEEQMEDGAQPTEQQQADNQAYTRRMCKLC